VECLLPGHTRVTLGTEDAGRFLSGMRRRGSWADAANVAVFAPSPSGGGQGWGHSRAGAPPSQAFPAGERSEPVLLGTGHVKAGELIPSRLLSPIEIQQIQGSEEPVPV